MRDTYKIMNAYPGKHSDKYNEVEISSDNLIYTELQTTHSGCQVVNIKNSDLIHQKCRQVAKLIKDIDLLNDPAN